VAELGEGPAYLEDEKALYYVDATEGEFCRVDTVTGQVTRRNVGNLVTVIVPYKNEPGNFIVSRRNELFKLNWQTGALTLLATLSPELNGRERFNDGKCDPEGRFFVGSVLEDGNGGVIANGGSLYRLDGNNLTRVATGFTLSNGMAFSNNNADELYFNDSEGRKVYIFDYNVVTGNLSNQRVLIDTADHPDFGFDEVPDGMAIDSYGYIWVSMWGGGRVVKINTHTARVVDFVRTPNVRIPTSVAFGDYQGKFGLYVTTAAIGIPEK
jgi:sugar lactone lactonase YvrE